MIAQLPTYLRNHFFRAKLLDIPAESGGEVDATSAARRHLPASHHRARRSCSLRRRHGVGGVLAVLLVLVQLLYEGMG